MLNPFGRVSGVVLSLVDVTERHSARRELERANGRNSALVERSSDATCVLDAEAIATYASPAYLVVYGEDFTERVGKSLLDRFHPDDRSKVSDALAGIIGDTDPIFTLECRVVDPVGKDSAHRPHCRQPSR
jgi:PAS domain-containing protein